MIKVEGKKFTLYISKLIFWNIEGLTHKTTKKSDLTQTFKLGQVHYETNVGDEKSILLNPKIYFLAKHPKIQPSQIGCVMKKLPSLTNWFLAKGEGINHEE